MAAFKNVQHKLESGGKSFDAAVVNWTKFWSTTNSDYGSFALNSASILRRAPDEFSQVAEHNEAVRKHPESELKNVRVQSGYTLPNDKLLLLEQQGRRRSMQNLTPSEYENLQQGLTNNANEWIKSESQPLGTERSKEFWTKNHDTVDVDQSSQDLKQAACASENPSTETSQNYGVPEGGCTGKTVLAFEAVDESKRTTLASARNFMETSWKNIQPA